MKNEKDFSNEVILFQYLPFVDRAIAERLWIKTNKEKWMPPYDWVIKYGHSWDYLDLNFVLKSPYILLEEGHAILLKKLSSGISNEEYAPLLSRYDAFKLEVDKYYKDKMDEKLTKLLEKYRK